MSAGFLAPLAAVLCSLGGGTPTAGAQSPSSTSQTIQLSAVSAGNWDNALWQLVDYPPSFSVPSGWSGPDANGNIYYNATRDNPNPPAFTMQEWGKIGVRLTVNGGVDPTGKYNPQRMIDTTCALEVVSPGLGLHDIFAGEGSVFGGFRSWVASIKSNLRTLDSSGGGSASGTSYNDTVAPPTTGATTVQQILDFLKGTGLIGSGNTPDQIGTTASGCFSGYQNTIAGADYAVCVGGASNTAGGPASGTFAGSAAYAGAYCSATLGGSGLASNAGYSCGVGGSNSAINAQYATSLGGANTIATAGMHDGGVVTGTAFGGLYGNGAFQISTIPISNATPGVSAGESVVLQSVLAEFGSPLAYTLGLEQKSYAIRVLASANDGAGNVATWNYTMCVHCDGAMSYIDSTTGGSFAPNGSAGSDAGSWRLTPSVTGTDANLTWTFNDGTSTAVVQVCARLDISEVAY